MHQSYKKTAMLIANINLVTVVAIQKTIQRQRQQQRLNILAINNTIMHI